jgi:HNH endonuclease
MPKVLTKAIPTAPELNDYQRETLTEVAAGTLDRLDPRANAVRNAVMGIVGPDALKAVWNEPFTEAEKAFRAKSLSEQAREVAAMRRPGDPVPPSQQVRAELASDQRLRWRIFDRDGYRCLDCGATGAEADLTIDHIRAVSLGGTNAETNLQTLCRSCNSRKGARY